MVNQQLVDYVKQQKQLNMSDDQIKIILLSKGWQQSDVDDAFKAIVSPALAFKFPGADVGQSGSRENKFLNKKLLLITSVVIVFLLLLGGSAFAYFKFFPSPESVLQKMTIKIAEIKSLEYSGEIKAEAEAGTMLGSGSSLMIGSENPNTSIKDNLLINFSSLINVETPDNPSSYFSFGIKTNAFNQKEIAFALDLRTIGKIIYLKLSQLPDLGFFDLKPLNDKWMKIDPESLKKVGVDIESENPNNFGLSQDQLTNIKLAFQKYRIFKVIEKMQSEKIGDLDMYHYKLDVEKDEMKKLFIEISEIVSKKKMTDQELIDFNKSFDESFDESIKTGESHDIQIWIGKKDFLPYKIYVGTSFKKTEKIKTSGNLSLTLNFKNFNQPVKIEAPDAKPVEQVFSELFAEFQGLSSNLDNEGLVDSDFDGLPDKVEAVYGTDPAKADTDADGFSDYNEIKDGYNPLGAGKLAADAPSLNELMFNTKNSGSKDRDSKRVADVRQIMSGVELFYNDANRYPLSNEVIPGKPLVYKETTYMAIVPSNPEPRNDGSCSTDNDYVYKRIDNKDGSQSYSLDYCLGGTVGDLQPGSHQASPLGIAGKVDYWE
ncbi:MAG: hypothetical protein NTY12_05565 [Candidatus Falkowbacteria bacterium]|nr:hypothetical protein [Candidatus Falkowbacteria bacterium]